MDNKPSLSQYFGGSEVPPASQFFDEIGTSPSEMIQSVYLGDSESNENYIFIKRACLLINVHRFYFNI